jgi:hypothetical protein
MQGTFDITESHQQLSAHEFNEMLKLRMMIQTIISSGQSRIMPYLLVACTDCCYLQAPGFLFTTSRAPQQISDRGCSDAFGSALLLLVRSLSVLLASVTALENLQSLSTILP